MFGLGLMELIIILVVILVLFGAGKLPGVMGEVGKGLSLFKKGMAGDDVEAPLKKAVSSKKKAKPTSSKKPASKGKA